MKTVCDDARALLLGRGVAFDEVDIRTDRDLLRAYRLEIPVVTVDGIKRFIGRVDEKRLEQLLDRDVQDQ
ncbi:MAG: glutaredoxin family protein [Planctomycetota bacterium]